MTDYLIVNATAAELTDVNAGNDDVAAYSQASITLDSTELAAVLALDGPLAVVKYNTDDDESAQKAAVEAVLGAGVFASNLAEGGGLAGTPLGEDSDYTTGDNALGPPWK
jgi:hypothetical protein